LSPARRIEGTATWQASKVDVLVEGEFIMLSSLGWDWPMPAEKRLRFEYSIYLLNKSHVPK